jgi:voltage-gated potassium channel
MNKRIWTYILGISAAFLILILTDFLLVYAEQNHPDSKVHSFGDAVWYMIVTITSVGYGDIVPVTPLGKAIGYFFLFTSLVVLGVLISSMTSNISKMIQENKLGYNGTNFTNHVICIGWNDFSRMVVDEVLQAERKVAIITNNKDEIDLIYKQYSNNDVFVLYADYQDLDLLNKTNPNESSEVFLGFNNDTETLIYVINFKKKYPKPNIVVAINNHKLRDTFHTAGVKHVVAINELASKLVASYVFEPDVANLNIDLLSSAKNDEDFDNQQYVVTESNPFLNKNYDDAFVALKMKYNIVLLGITKHKDGHNQLIVNARADTIIEINDYLIIMVGGKVKRRVEKLFGTKEGKICCKS